MAVSYKVVSKKPRGLAGTLPVKYYPVITNRSVIDLRDLCDRISEKSSLTSGDIMAVVESLIQDIPTLLMNGYNVKLDNFGTFSIHASAEGKDDPTKVRGRDVTSVKMSFLPSKYVKHKLKFTKFKKSTRKR